MINVVGDVGRALVDVQPDALRQTLPYFAAVREGLEYGGQVERSPHQVLLEGPQAAAYLAGALWACSGVINAYIERTEADDQRSEQRASRSQVQRIALDLLRSRSAIRPGDVIDTASVRGPAPSPALVSKVIGDLLADGMVVVAEVDGSGDRRSRWYQLADAGEAVPSELVRETRACIEQLLTYVSEKEAHELLASTLAEAAA